MSNTVSVSNINSLVYPTRSNGHTSSNSESFIIPSAPRRIARKLKQLESIVSPTDTIDYTTSTAVSPSTVDYITSTAVSPSTVDYITSTAVSPSTVDYITSTILLSSTVIEPTQNASTTCDDYYYYSLCTTDNYDDVLAILFIFAIIMIVIFLISAFSVLLYIGVLTISFIIAVCGAIWQHVMRRRRLRSTERNADSTNQEGKLIIILVRSIHHNKSSRSRNGDKFCNRGTRYYNQYS